jgi:methyl-accepting chemotaxis protein
VNALTPVPPGPPGDTPEQLRRLLQAWVQLGEIERRGFLAMVEEVAACSTLIEDSTLALSARFRDLALAADAQTARVERIAGVARSIDVGGTTMVLSDAARLVEGALDDAIAGLLDAAGQATAMAQALEEVTREVQAVEACLKQIDAINRQARFVALNAMIEAQRAEGAAGTFTVIAHELKELSKDTDAAAQLVRERIGRASRGVATANGRLTRIAGTDQAGLEESRRRLGAVIHGMMAQNAAMAETLEEARTAARAIDEVVGQLVTGTQFQDRATQHLTHVIEALQALGEATGSLQAESLEAIPTLETGPDAENGLIRSLLDRPSLSAVRQRFLARLLDDTAPPPPAAEAGDIELF